MSILNSVQKGRKLKPLALMFHAPHGIGKSTFAAEAPNPIYIGNEENDELDVARFPKVVTWNDLESQLRALLSEKHSYQTVVIDTIDGLEQVAEQTILSSKEAANKTMATAFGGYGKAYEKMENMFLNIRDNFLVPLRDQKGMNIVILAHSSKVKHEDPMTNTSYDHFETAIHKRVKPIFEDWVSAIFFANYYLVKAENNAGKEYAEGIDGMRMIYTEERPSHVAKNRFTGMPYEVEFKKHGTWNDIKQFVLKHYADAKPESKPVLKEEVTKPSVEEKINNYTEADDLRNTIAALSLKIPAESRAGVELSVARAKDDIAELTRILKKVQGILK